MSQIVDFHSHVLPGIDDGSKDPEMSLQMLCMLAKQGITHVVATPHFYPQYDTPERFLRRRSEAEAALREAMAGENGLPALSVGAEVYYFSGMSDSEAIRELTIDENRCILVEMPGMPWTEAMYRELEALYVKRGLLPVVAHVDRYISRFHTHGILKRLESLPVLVQANAEFFLERSTARMALRMLKNGAIHLLGSDCHNLTDRRPNLGEAIELIQQRLGTGALEHIRFHEQLALEGENNVVNMVNM